MSGWSNEYRFVGRGNAPITRVLSYSGLERLGILYEGSSKNESSLLGTVIRRNYGCIGDFGATCPSSQELVVYAIVPGLWQRARTHTYCNLALAAAYKKPNS